MHFTCRVRPAAHEALMRQSPCGSPLLDSAKLSHLPALESAGDVNMGSVNAWDPRRSHRQKSYRHASVMCNVAICRKHSQPCPRCRNIRVYAPMNVQRGPGNRNDRIQGTSPCSLEAHRGTLDKPQRNNMCSKDLERLASEIGLRLAVLACAAQVVRCDCTIASAVQVPWVLPARCKLSCQRSSRHAIPQNVPTAWDSSLALSTIFCGTDSFSFAQMLQQLVQKLSTTLNTKRPANGRPNRRGRLDLQLTAGGPA